MGTALAKYEGTIYYEGTQPETYYQVGYKDLTQTIPAGMDLHATREGYQFAGWSKDKDAKDPDADLAAGQSITIPKGMRRCMLFGKIGAGDRSLYDL